jgi:hypothetical protein
VAGPDVELLADLDAGVLGAGRAEEVRSASAADPAAEAVLRALATTRADLAALPAPPVPPVAATRWAAALDAEAAGARPARRRSRPALVAAALLVVLVAVLPLARSGTPATLVAAGQEAVGRFDVGGLSDVARRAGCLAAVAAPGVAPDAPLVGGRFVEVDGRQGVLLVLAGGEPGVLHIVVVDPECAPGRGTLLSSTLIGR